MPELAYNIIWSWEPIIRALFRRLDPTLWRDCGYNPVLMLGRISQAALAKAAADHRYLSLYSQACQRYDDAMQRRRSHADGELIAYFSAEYGLSECLPIYSGGLGILSGDHLKSASNCELPLVGVGLLYQQGYFRQFLNQDGWQQERYPTNDFYTLPMRPVTDEAGNELKVTVRLPTGNVYIQVWHIDVGRRLYLLDTSIRTPAAGRYYRSLYGGDTDTRIRQEIVLGIGRLRTLRAMESIPPCFIERGPLGISGAGHIRRLIEDHKLSFERWKYRGRTMSSPPTPRCRPASTCSIPGSCTTTSTNTARKPASSSTR